MRKFSLWLSSLVQPIEKTEEKADDRQEARSPEIRIYTDQEAFHFSEILGFIVSQLFMWYILLSPSQRIVICRNYLEIPIFLKKPSIDVKP